MVPSRDESSPSRTELVVLACLSQKTPPSDVELGDAVQQLALPAEPPEVARQRAVELLAGLVRRAWVTGEGDPVVRGKRRKAEPPRKLTEAGKRVLRAAFHVSRVPSWAQVRDRHLPALALGPAGSEAGATSCTEEALMAAVLGARFGVRGASTLTGVCDALIAQALGMPPGKLTLDRIRAHVLLRGIDRQAPGLPSPGTKGYAAKVGAWIASSAVGARETQRRMGRALARRWVCGEAEPLGASSAAVAAPVAAPAITATPAVLAGKPPATPVSAAVATRPAAATPASGVVATRPPAVTAASPGAASPVATAPAATAQVPLFTVVPPPPPPAPPQNLLDVVRETISRIGTEGRFGEKVYVSAIWRRIERDRRAGDLSLDHFKSWLVRANRDGWLVLARADLIGAMDAKQINESEINDRGATFHFVLDQRSRASASQRESHAR